MSVFSMAASNTAGPTYPLQRSVRLRSSASAYFNRTPASTTNRRTFTWSGWVKRGALADGVLITASNGSQYVYFAYSTNTLTLQINTGTNYIYTTTAVFRDPSAWYHVVLAVDTTQALDANRVQIYINGVAQARSAGGVPQNTDTQVNVSAVPSWMGSNGGVNTFFDGYLEEINFIDGQALTPSSFGAYNNYGVWSPAKYTGSYGTNGFYLNFQDNSSVTTTANVGIGADSSGNGNYWTSNGINVSPYTGTPPNNVSYDSMTDVPTNTSATNANFAVLNPLDTVGTAGSIAAGNLQLTGGSAAWYQSRIGFGITSGKWYWEVTIILTNAASNGVDIGIANSSAQLAGFGQANQWIYNNNVSGRKSLNGTASAYGSAFVTSDVIGVAFDADAGTLEFYKNNTSQGVAASSGLPNPAFPLVAAYGTDSVAINFGQRPFSYTPPTGFKSLNTFNLPDSIVPVGAQYFAATTYTGPGTAVSIANTTSNPLVSPFSNNPTAIAMLPDFLWIKQRNNTANHVLADSVRGVNKYIFSNLTNQEATATAGTGITAFNANGFSLGTETSTVGSVNAASGTGTYVAWQWRASNASAVTNTAGTISSQVSANRTAGFSIVTYTGTLTATPGVGAMPTVGHGLNAVPQLIISKSRTVAGVDSGAWAVFSSQIATDSYLRLNTTAGTASVSGGGGGTMVAPTSSVFSTPYISGSNINANNYVAYCWSEIPGYSKFGFYTGNTTNLPFVYLGFKPRFLLVKRVDATGGDWCIVDTSRDPYNVVQDFLYPSAALQEQASAQYDALSNGFRLRGTAANTNANGVNYIYAAFAENPFKNALAG